MGKECKRTTIPRLRYENKFSYQNENLDPVQQPEWTRTDMRFWTCIMSTNTETKEATRMSSYQDESRTSTI